MIELFPVLLLAVLCGSLLGAFIAKGWYARKVNNMSWVQQHLEMKAIQLRNELDHTNRELISLRSKHRKLLLGKVSE